MSKVYIYNILALFLLFVLACGQIPETNSNKTSENKRPEKPSEKNPIGLPFEQLSGDPITILSLHGGGIRGVMTASLLERIEEETDKRAHQLFDIVIGSESGGIIALAITNPNTAISGKEIKDFFITNASDIFPPHFKKDASGNLQLISKKKRTKRIQGAFNKLLGNNLFKNASKPTLVTTVDKKEYRGRILESDVKCFDDLTTTAVAGATFFALANYKPQKISLKNENGELIEHNLADGSVYRNNPAILAYRKAKSIYGGEQIKKRGIILVSLGAGNPVGRDPIGERLIDSGPLTWKDYLEDLLRDASSNDDEEILNFIFKKLPHSRLIRIEPDIDQSVNEGIFNTKNIEKNNIKNLLNLAENKKKSTEFKEAIELLNKFKI